MSKATSGGAAHNAAVSTTEPADPERTVLEQEAAAAFDAVDRMEAKMVGWQQALEDARDAADVAQQRLEELGD